MALALLAVMASGTGTPDYTSDMPPARLGDFRADAATILLHPCAGDRLFEECGVTVHERDDASPKIGACAGNTTGDPRVFGPDAWRTWHRYALVKSCRSFCVPR